MTDTVTRLLALADDYALRNYHHDTSESREAARQALVAELTRLFTPLSDEQIHNADPLPHRMFDTQRIEFARAIEQQHGITGEKK